MHDPYDLCRGVIVPYLSCVFQFHFVWFSSSFSGTREPQDQIVFLQRSFISGRHSLTCNAHRGALSNIDEFTHQGLASEAVHIWGYANVEKVSPRSRPLCCALYRPSVKDEKPWIRSPLGQGCLSPFPPPPPGSVSSSSLASGIWEMKSHRLGQDLKEMIKFGEKNQGLRRRPENWRDRPRLVSRGGPRQRAGGQGRR